MGVKVRVGFKGSVGVQNGQKLTLGAFGAHGLSGFFGAPRLLRPVPLTTNCWLEAPWGGGGGLASEDPRNRSPRVILACGNFCFLCIHKAQAPAVSRRSHADRTSAANPSVVWTLVFSWCMHLHRV